MISLQKRRSRGVCVAEKRAWPNDEGYMGANIISKASLFSYAGDFQCKALLGEMTFRCLWNTLPSLATDNALQRCDMYSNGSKSSLDDFFLSCENTTGELLTRDPSLFQGQQFYYKVTIGMKTKKSPVLTVISFGEAYFGAKKKRTKGIFVNFQHQYLYIQVSLCNPASLWRTKFLL